VTRLKFAYALLAILAISVRAHGAEPESPEGRFQAYWTAYSSGDYAAAAKFMHPEDMAGLKTDLLPVFIGAARSSNGEVRQIVEAFFEGIPESQRAKLSGTEVFVQLSKFVATASPELMEFMKKSRVQSVSMNIDATDPTKGLVKYTLQVADVSQPATQVMQKVNGVWFLRANERPADVAAKFRTMLQG
jgi:hypothetical protein